MEGYSINKMKKLWTLTKMIACIVCLVGFVANSSYIFKQFIGRKTVTSHNIKKYQKLGLPSVTICSVSGFKKMMNDSDDLEIQNYLSETIDLNEVLHGAAVAGEYLSTLEEMDKNWILWKRTTTYSKFKGRCHTPMLGLLRTFGP